MQDVINRLQGEPSGLLRFWDEDVYVGDFVFKTRMMCDNPAANAVITDIAITDDD